MTNHTIRWTKKKHLIYLPLFSTVIHFHFHFLLFHFTHSGYYNNLRMWIKNCHNFFSIQLAKMVNFIFLFIFFVVVFVFNINSLQFTLLIKVILKLSFFSFFLSFILNHMEFVSIQFYLIHLDHHHHQDFMFSSHWWWWPYIDSLFHWKQQPPNGPKKRKRWGKKFVLLKHAEIKSN